MEIENLKENYELVCNTYLNEFCKKQNLTNEGWINDKVGEIACCSEFFFNFSDIVWDINSKQTKDTIKNWYYDSLENVNKSMNYYSYTKGLRFNDI